MTSRLSVAAGTIGVAIVGCHIVLLSSGPFDRSLPTHLLQLAVIFLAILSALACAWRSQGFSRQFWALIAFGFGVLAVAQTLRIYERFWDLSAAHVEALGIRDFPFLFYMVPFVLALFLHENRRDCIKAAGYLDAMQVVAICFMLFNAVIYSRMTGAHAIAADEISKLFSVVVVARNLGVTGAFWLRGEFSCGNERSALRTMAVYLSVYTAGSVLGHWVYNTARPQPNWIELEGTVPFVVAVVLISRWREQPVVAQKRPGKFHRLMSLHLVPSLLPMMVVFTGIGLWPSHPKSTSVVMGVSSFLFGLRLLVTSYSEHHAAEKLAERTSQLESANAQLRTEIVEHELVEEALRFSEEKFSKTFTNSPTGVAITRIRDGVFLDVNDTWMRLVGYSREEMIGRSTTELKMWLTPEAREHFVHELRKNNGTLQRWKQELWKKSGEVFTAELSVQVIALHGEDVLVATLVDITETQKAVEALRESESRFRALFESSPDAVFLTIPDGRVIAANPAACAMFHMSEAEICRVGRQGLVDGDDPRHIAAMEERPLTSRAVKTELSFLRNGGERFPAEVDSVILPGSPPRAFLILRDITERKRAEEALIRSEKLASIGRMAVTIAHEINNPLAAVMNLLFLVNSSKHLPEPERRLLAIADAELKRIAHITRQSLGFYRESKPPTLVSMNEILESALDLLQSKVETKHAVIERKCDPDIQITAVDGELRQVFANLISNSLDAVDERGTIKLRASRRNRWVRITVADNGSGIPPRIQKQIFDPLFTTKAVVGTGLGLWVSKQIIEKHGGAIRVRSRCSGVHRGTIFSVVLPVRPASLTLSSAAD